MIADQTVPSQFPSTPHCDLAFVGEAPSMVEVERGQPFVGPSGQVFDAILRSAGVDRDLCYIGNVIDEQLPGNEFANYAGDIGAQLTRLEHELNDVQPTVIVPLGGTALWAFTGNSGIVQARGAVQQGTKLCAGRKLVPTLHPAFVMRQWKWYSVAIGDIGRALDEARLGPAMQWPVKALYLEPRISDVRDLVAVCRAAQRVAVDIETGWGFVTCIGFAPTIEDAWCVPFVSLACPSRSYWKTKEEEYEALMLVKEIMEDPSIKKVGQNFCGYDAYWLHQKLGIKTMGLEEDTRLLHHSLYPELPKDLGFMGASYTRQGPWKLMRSRNREEKRDD